VQERAHLSCSRLATLHADPRDYRWPCPASCTRSPMRATGHGISADVGKLGAFIGVFLFPILSGSLGLRGTLLLTAGMA
jgi:hypothetical protein